jgi:hypothetical protein
MSTFFMVYAQGKETPAYQHETLQDAQKEAIRLSKKLGVKCYVLGVLVECDVNKPIEVKKHKPKKPCWFEYHRDMLVRDFNALMQKLKEEGDVPDLPECEPEEYNEGDVVYCYNNEVYRIGPTMQLAMMIKLFGTELRIKEE